MGARGAIVGVVVVGVLAGGAVVVDRVLHAEAEQRIAGELQDEIPGLATEPDVTVHGFPFLTQVLAGELGAVDVTAPEATVQDLVLEDVVVRLEQVSTSRPTTAGSARMTAYAPLDQLTAALDLPLDLVIEGDRLVASTQLLGLPLEVLLVPTAGGDAVLVDVDGLRLAGATVSASDLPSALTEQLEGLEVPIDGLPEGLELTDLTLDEGGAQLVAEGTDVVLTAEGAG
ncbi:DUF2993 domain-containing protein [Cellulomonas sp. APG4]|uniref:LmeA family phospholipid-binding protein n=1 Tax=Cellulomonas sp. APG4 TaxID=1538656 RepID=UPI00137B0AEB|nr:DUF2993 domain-containing protein [Cellulomonas sp. APG4]NCT91037.1 DUF2993 domain-containing protein [Cellulomonas sp. APG4]